MTTAWFDTVRDLTLRFVGWPSVTNTPDEQSWSQSAYEMLSQTPYFQAHPQHLRLVPTVHDRYRRSNLFAFVQGEGSATAILSGHYDVVSIENYGALKPWATDPMALTPRLIAELETNARTESDHLALRDLQSGQFMPGRGALDMKSGLAAGVAVLLHFAAQPERRGNLLLIATPDEEEGSHGMCSAALHLPTLVDEWGLELTAAINLDASSDHGDGSAGQAVYLGTVGKFLPSVYVVGRDTHAGYPFDGLNANFLAAAVTQRIECNVALCDEFEGELAPPPVNLEQYDLKTQYDVTVPGATWCCFNYLTHGKSAASVLDIVVGEVRGALEAAVAANHQQAQRYAARMGGFTPHEWPVTVMTYAALQAKALDVGGQRIKDSLAALTTQLMDDQGLDAPTFTRRIIEFLWQASGLNGPAAVVGFGSLHYPHSLVDATTPHHARLREIVRHHAKALADERDTPICVRNFFAGISDMSFLGSAMEPHDEASIKANTPLWGSRIVFDYAAVRRLDLPTINIGPWGRDYHQRNERVFMPYSFEIVPELIWRIAQSVLNT